MSNMFEMAKVLNLAEAVPYETGGIVSKQVLESGAGNITAFSFSKGQGLSPHSAPFDAFVQILDGVAEIAVGDSVLTLRAGESVIMPANVPHALKAVENFKMLLTMIKA